MIRASFKRLADEKFQCEDCKQVFDKIQMRGHSCRGLVVSGNKLACIHRGEQVDTVGCTSCPKEKNVRLKVFSCTELGRCTVGTPSPNLACCAICNKYASMPKALSLVPKAPKKVFSNLAVITCYFNPQGYQRPRHNLSQFLASMSQFGVRPHVAEMAFDDDPFVVQDADLQIRGSRAQHLMFQKERLLNLLIGQLAENYDAIAWLDAVVLFLNPNWIEEALEKLKEHHVIQMHESVYDLTPRGHLVSLPMSTGRLWQDDPKPTFDYRHSHPGHAWAGRADWIRRHGLFDQCVTGGGDVTIMQGFTSGWKEFGARLPGLSQGWLTAVDAWCSNVYEEVAGSIGCIEGSLMHLYHGSIADRHYADRWRMLAQFDFDPLIDLESDPKTRALQWTDFAMRNKQGLIHAVADGFVARREDASVA